jgi:DNA-binding XRE family transcriptional regulator
MALGDDDFRKKLGDKIAEIRALKKYGVREFALIANIEHHQLINIEKGRVDLRLSTLIKIADAFDIPPKDLFNF